MAKTLYLCLALVLPSCSSNTKYSTDDASIVDARVNIDAGSNDSGPAVDSGSATQGWIPLAGDCVIDPRTNVPVEYTMRGLGIKTVRELAETG